jgi:hypothetical protein
MSITFGMMSKKRLIQQLIDWIEQLNDYLGCDNKELILCKQLWGSTVHPGSCINSETYFPNF